MFLYNKTLVEFDLVQHQISFANFLSQITVKMMSEFYFQNGFSCDYSLGTHQKTVFSLTHLSAK